MCVCVQKTSKIEGEWVICFQNLILHYHSCWVNSICKYAAFTRSPGFGSPHWAIGKGRKEQAQTLQAPAYEDELKTVSFLVLQLWWCGHPADTAVLCGRHKQWVQEQGELQRMKGKWSSFRPTAASHEQGEATGQWGSVGSITQLLSALCRSCPHKNLCSEPH